MYEKNSLLDEKIDLLFQCIKEDGGIFDLLWCTDLLYPYYKHFDDTNLKYRAGSIIAFCGLLQEWEDGSGFPFYTGIENYQCHDFKEYMKEFINFSNTIKTYYPNTYNLIIALLKDLDSRFNLEITFPDINKHFIDTIREQLFIDEVILNQELYQNVFQEIGVLN